MADGLERQGSIPVRGLVRVFQVVQVGQIVLGGLFVFGAIRSFEVGRGSDDLAEFGTELGWVLAAIAAVIIGGSVVALWQATANRTAAAKVGGAVAVLVTAMATWFAWAVGAPAVAVGIVILGVTWLAICALIASATP